MSSMHSVGKQFQYTNSICNPVSIVINIINIGTIKLTPNMFPSSCTKEIALVIPTKTGQDL